MKYSNGKGASMANAHQRKLESEHSSNDQFVRKVQNAQAKMAGKTPNLESEAMNYNAYMCNTGTHAQELARKLTAKLDKTAYPVK